MPSLIPLQNSIVYGPILSRRLGRSLGVNLFPSDRKICSYNCIYCHFGGTTDHVGESPADGGQSGNHVPSIDDVLHAIELYLRSEHEFEYITLSGNGEPTMYPKFAELIPRLKALIAQHRPSVKLVLLSNSTTLGRPEVVSAICRIDVPTMKLDAGDQATFEALNRPCPGVRIEQIIDGLTQLVRRCAIVLQTVMVDGPVSNSTGEALDRWIAAVEKIRPASIQVYTSDRPVADSRIRKLDAVKLDEIARLVTGRTGVPARAYY